MKLNTGINLLKSRNVEKTLSKKILLANTSDKDNMGKTGVASPMDPIYFKNSKSQNIYNPDIRFLNNWNQSPLNNINIRNSLLLFAENNEIKKALRAITNEMVISNLKSNKYPVYPDINFTLIPEDKQDTIKAMDKYIQDVFYPKLFRMLKFKKKGLTKLINEYLVTGKIAYEIVYDNLKRPKEIVNMVPIDTSTIQKYKENNQVWYVQKPISSDSKPRILHENQIVLIEWNEYDFGYVSYIDQLRRPFNIMRGMQSAKVLWFAVKSQVRMHIKLNMGDVPRSEAIQKLAVARDEYSNDFYLNETSGEILFNGEPDTVGYHEYFTAETTASGSPEIDEVNSNGPDLTEVDSLQYWEKMFWKETEIPFDRIDPSSAETWNFVDVTNVRKSEINFSKFIMDIKETINEIFLKPLIIQMTLMEVEIGVDLTLLDAIKIEWVSFNEYDKLGELEVLDKKVQIATSLSQFGQMVDVNGNPRSTIPIAWIIDNYLDFTEEQKESMRQARIKENIELGFEPEETTPIVEVLGTENDDDFSFDEFEDPDDNADNIRMSDDRQY